MFLGPLNVHWNLGLWQASELINMQVIKLVRSFHSRSSSRSATLLGFSIFARLTIRLFRISVIRWDTLYLMCRYLQMITIRNLFKVNHDRWRLACSLTLLTLLNDERVIQWCLNKIVVSKLEWIRRKVRSRVFALWKSNFKWIRYWSYWVFTVYVYYLVRLWAGYFVIIYLLQSVNSWFIVTLLKHLKQLELPRFSVKTEADPADCSLLSSSDVTVGIK